MNKRKRAAVAIVTLAGWAITAPARAADEEIQVYMDEIGPPHRLTLDIHINDVLAGDGAPAYQGAETSLHRWRITPEFGYALDDRFELGLYLPLATITPDGKLRAEGAKLRLKWLAPHKPTGFYWGANFEIGKVAHRLDENPWNAELKLIGGWRNERWQLGVNGNIDFKVSGPAPAPATFELATRLGYRLTPKLTLGVENYNGMGAFRSLGHLSQNDHATYLTVDTELGGFDLNAGIGKGYGTNGDSTVVKFVIGVPI
ncbi:MAG: hypothetical protein KGN34_14440 [Sphingomonadales bacterium]|nr:hypothetical protein [Sphingomonadales bacterium]